MSTTLKTLHKYEI